MNHFLRNIILMILSGLSFSLRPSAQAYDYSLLPPMNGQDSDFAERRAGKEVNASIRLGVTQEGLYRVTYSSLTNAGVAQTNLVGSMMRLFCRTQEVAILVSSSNQWTASDYFIFPGSGYDGYYSETNVYWLGFGEGGKRMTTRSGAPLPAGTLVTSCRKYNLHHKDNYFDNGYRPAEDSIDHWYDFPMDESVIGPGQVVMATDYIVTNQSAVFNAVLLGYSDSPGINPDHCMVVKAGSYEIGRFAYDGKTTEVVSAAFPATWLQATNALTFTPTLTNGAIKDKVCLERCSVTYTRALYSDQNTLAFEGVPGTNNYLVRGFTQSNSFQVFDATDPWNGVLLTNGQITNTASEGVAVLFGDTAQSTSRYFACHTSAVRNVSFVQRTFFRDLASTNHQADYVVICPYEFRQQVYRLLALRHAQGLSVAVAPLPDLYNEFGYGLADAAVIKQFIGYAFHRWARSPRYVLLAGTGTYDPRHHASQAPDWVPVYQGPCYNIDLGRNLWTSLDNWYATVQKDGTNDYNPNVFIGRIPVETITQLSNVVNKIVAFEGVPTNGPLRNWAMLVADSDDAANGLDFDAASDELLVSNLTGMEVKKEYKATFGSSDGVVSEINDGKLFVNYFGHGGAGFWSSTPSLLTLASVTNSLNNTYYPIVTMLTCLNGAYQDPALCLVEAFLQGPHGASACVADSGLTSLIASQDLAQGFYQALRDPKKKRIGDAMEAAYKNLFLMHNNTREALFYELFGDPAMLVNP
jgi:hypothetical protein